MIYIVIYLLYSVVQIYDIEIYTCPINRNGGSTQFYIEILQINKYYKIMILIHDTIYYRSSIILPRSQFNRRTRSLRKYFDHYFSQ
jgi:hypothetical protein